MVDATAVLGMGFFPWFPLATGKLARPGGPLDDEDEAPKKRTRARKPKEADDEDSVFREPRPRKRPEKAEKPALREAPRGAGSEPQEAEPTRKKSDKATAAQDGSGNAADAEQGAQIVSLDKFRKK